MFDVAVLAALVRLECSDFNCIIVHSAYFGERIMSRL